MRRRRLWFRRISTAVATVAVGALVGFLVPTIAADLSPRPQLELARVSESPVAREFIDAYVSDDQAALDRIGVDADMKLRATRYRTEFQRVDAPVHLGSFVGSGFTVHGYAARVVDKDGKPGLLSWRVATIGGQVLVLPPPTGIEQP
ncbi:MAG TPA: hypothetical protein VFI69_11095 [Candidatus Limnocylindrales bacterium]|jgi:hypothetical protein|nr:hypothetical protein [Candidatus Limnocylindrales bacterium]